MPTPGKRMGVPIEQADLLTETDFRLPGHRLQDLHLQEDVGDAFA